MLIRPVYRPRMPSLALGLVAWFPLDDGQAAIDYSGRCNVGTLVNSPTPQGGIARGAFGNGAGGALKFNGTNNYVSLPANGTNVLGVPISGFTKGTIALWCNPPSATRQVLFSFSAGSATFTILAVEYCNQSAAAKDFTIYAFNSIINQGVSTNAGFAAGLWHHVVVTQGGSAQKIYVDGSLQANLAGSTPGAGWFSDISAGDTCRIGSRRTNNINSQFANGAIDDVRVYNRALSPAEVLALYAEAFQPQIDIETIALMQGTQQTFLAAWAMQRNQISQGWAS